MNFKLHELLLTVIVSICLWMGIGAYMSEDTTLDSPAAMPPITVPVPPTPFTTTAPIHTPTTTYPTLSYGYAPIVSKDGEAHAALYRDAVLENIRPEHHHILAPLVAAIRYQENGRAGLEYGCMSEYAKDRGYRKQAGECALTVQYNYDRYLNGGCRIAGCFHKDGTPGDTTGYIAYLGHVYCPLGAKNDPMNLNVHWISGVTSFYNTFTN